jgi:hypothetical protein
MWNPFWFVITNVICKNGEKVMIFFLLQQHLSMKEGNLFCIYEIHRTRMLQIVFFVSLESSWEEGCMGLVAWHLDLQFKSFWIMNDSSLKIKLNCSWKFQRHWNVVLVLLERSWWAGFNEIYLVRFGFRVWEILNFKWFLPLKIQINSKKGSFGRKNQLRMW